MESVDVDQTRHRKSTSEVDHLCATVSQRFDISTPIVICRRAPYSDQIELRLKSQKPSLVLSLRSDSHTLMFVEFCFDTSDHSLLAQEITSDELASGALTFL